MEQYWVFTLAVFTGFFAIMNPIANIPIFLGLVQDLDHKSRKIVALRSTLVAFIIVALFVVAGKFIFDAFGITIPAFKITGGILVFFIGFEMLHSKPPSSHKGVGQQSHPDLGMAISPLATPILAGPGTIVTAMNNVTDAEFTHILITIIVFAFMCFLTWLAFVASEKLMKIVGQNVIMVLGKIMGLIIAIIGIQMIIEGIKGGFGL